MKYTHEIAQAFAAYGSITVEQATDYLRSCDDLAELPGGAIVRRKNVVHIVSPQRGLSGRRLVRQVRDALAKFHLATGWLFCPIQRENERAVRFAEFFGFTRYASCGSHDWFKRFSGDMK